MRKNRSASYMNGAAAGRLCGVPARVWGKPLLIFIMVLLLSAGGTWQADGIDTVVADGDVEIWFQQGVSPDAETRVDDAYLSFYSPSTNFGGPEVQGMEVDGFGYLRPLIRFDVSIIPSGSVVTAATLHMRANYKSVRPDEVINVGVYPLGKEWGETEANWYMATSEETWDYSGADGPGDRSSEPIDEVELQAVNAWYEWDVTSAVQHWVDRPDQSHGLILIGAGPQLRVERGFWTSAYEHSPSQRPKLRVVYSSPSGATSTPTITPTPSVGPTATPTPRAVVSSNTSNCMTVGTDAPHPDRESVLLIWEGEAQWAKLYLDVSNDRHQYAVYVNDQLVGRSGGTNAGSTCAVGRTEEWDLDPSILVSGWNEIRITNDEDPSDLWGATNGRIVIAGDVDAPEYRTVAFQSSYDGYTQTGMVQLPVGYSEMEAMPLLVVLHWWGADFTDAIYDYHGFASEASERGWILASPDLRSQHTASLAVQHNVIDIVNHMKSNYRVDPSRVYLTGASMGGMIAATTAAKYPDVFAAVVEQKGPTNLSNWYYETNSWRASTIEREVGHAPWQAPFEYQRRSSESMAMNLKHVPFAILHGNSDTVVPPSQAQGLYDAISLFGPAHLDPIHWYAGDHDTVSPFGPDWVLDYLGGWTLSEMPTDLNIRTDESKAFYWLGVTQGGWAQRWTSVEASYDVYSSSIRATVSDVSHSHVDIVFYLADIGLDTESAYVVEDYNHDTGDFQVYAAIPSAGRLSLSFPDGDTHELSIYPGNVPPLVEHIFQQGAEGYVGVEDTHLYAYDREARFYDKSTAKLNYNSTYTPLFRFDLAKVPGDAVIKSALLYLYVHGRSDDKNVQAGAHAVLRDWDVERATWLSATDAEEWDIEGANGVEDRRGEPVDVVELGSPREWGTWNLRALVEEWVQNESVNHGVILKGQGAPSVAYDLASSEYYAPERGPKLVVKYVFPTATLPPTGTPTITPTPSETPTPTRTATPGDTPTLTHTPTPSATPSLSPTPSVTPTASPTPRTAVIQGYVWNDVNGNGERDEGEDMLTGATLIVSDLMRREVTRHVTIGGEYSFVLPAPAEYYLEEVNPRGYVSTGPDLLHFSRVEVDSVVRTRFGDRPAPLCLPLLIKGS